MVSSRDRAGVFVDNGYLSKVLKRDFDERRIHHLKFSESICRGSERFRTYFYYCMPYQSPNPSEDERQRTSQANKFYHSLRNHPRFEVRLGRLAKISASPPKYEQKGVDVLLSVDLVRLSWSHAIDKAVLVTGDSDFVPAVQAAKDAGVIVELFYSPSQHISSELYQACDERSPITEGLVEACSI